MSNFEIFHEIPIKCKSSVLFDAITREDLISQWWLEGSKIKSVKGETGVFPLSDGSGKIEMKIEDISTGSSVCWKCIDHKHKDWINTLVTFYIYEEEDNSVLQFRHSGWKTKDGVFGKVSFFWAALYLRNLKLILEN